MRRMTMIVFLLAVLFAANARGQNPTGTSFGSKVIANSPPCELDATHFYVCFGDDGAIYTSFKGAPYVKVPQGAPGPAGQAATITIGTVTQTAPGTLPSVTNSGTSNAAKLDFTFPQASSVPPPGTAVCYTLGKVNGANAITFVACP